MLTTPWRRTLAFALTGLLATLPAIVLATGGFDTGPFGFEPIAASADSADWNPAAPWLELPW